MNDRAWIVFGLIGAAIWLLTRRRGGPGGAAPAGGQISVTSFGPTINENLELDAILDKLTGPYGLPYRVSITTPEYLLRYQHLMPFDPYDSPVLNPQNVQRP